MVVFTLANAVTTNGAGTGVAIGAAASFTATLTGIYGSSVIVNILSSADDVTYTLIDSITLSLPNNGIGNWSTSTSANYFRIDVLNITGTNASVSVVANAQVNVGNSKTITSNNAAAAVTIPVGTSYYAFTGTNVGTLPVNFPPATLTADDQKVTVYFSAAVGTALTLASTGGTFVDAPATVAAKTRVSFIFNKATNQWLSY